MAKPTSHVLQLVWSKVVPVLPGPIPKALELSVLLHSSQFLVAWHVTVLPAFILQPSLGLFSCLPNPSRTFYLHKCVLEQTHCTL